MKCNANMTMLAEIDSSSDECSVYYKYETEAGCSYVTMRPFWRLMDKISILNGTMLIALGLVMVFYGKAVVEWTLRIALTIFFSFLIFDIANNLLPRTMTFADGILLTLICAMALALSILMAWALTMVFEAVVPLAVSASLFILVSLGLVMVFEARHFVGSELVKST